MLLKQVSFVVMIGIIGVVAVKLYQKVPAEEPAMVSNISSPDQSETISEPPNGYSDIIRISQSGDGHFYTDLKINGRDIRVLIDTGASFLALRDSDAQSAGLYPKPTDFSFPVNTANGEVMAAIVEVDKIELEMLVVSDAKAFVLPDTSLKVSLLGMNVLSKLGEVSLYQSELTIERAR